MTMHILSNGSCTNHKIVCITIKSYNIIIKEVKDILVIMICKKLRKYVKKKFKKNC